MTIAEILETVKFVINSNGQKSAVMVDLDIWEQIVSMLEDLEDAEEMKQAKMVREETVPWNVAKKELNLGE
jgi:PHD/YefM family antitoxin component YafN of YafNO toxin-antitoxin module